MIRVTGSNQQTERQSESNPVPSPFRLFEDVFNAWAMRNALDRRREAWRPPVDILEKDGNLILRIEIPGLEEKDIDLRLDGKTLTIQGERRPEGDTDGYNYRQVESFYGSFSRSFDLPDSVDRDRISAAFRNGVLAITLPQRPEVKPRSIQVAKG